MTSGYYLLVILIASIGFIIWTTAYRKLNAFFALLLAAFGVGVFSGMDLAEILTVLKTGFGNTMGRIGLLIIFGTALGIVLERTGATMSMANAIINKVLEKNAPAAIAITGFIVGLPIFCDSAFIILNGLNHSLVRRTQFTMPVMATVLATSLYAVHCLVPPHPGISAAVATMGGDIGVVMIGGVLLAVPAAGAGYLWSVWRGNKIDHKTADEDQYIASATDSPGAIASFLPVIIPISLIALKSIVLLYATAGDMDYRAIAKFIAFTGDPVVALGIGLLTSLVLVQSKDRSELSHWLSDGIAKAGVILAIIAAGGMFGEILQAAGVSANLGNMLSGFSLGVFLPFIVTAVIKTAQGSSTVAIITASSLVMPLMSDLGLDTSHGVVLTILSMGAGSMMVSHANDSYFWVISRFSGLDTATTLKVYTTATAVMAMVVQLTIWLILLFL